MKNTFGRLRTDSPFGQCRLVLHSDARPCPNDASGPDHMCDECRIELDDFDRARESNYFDDGPQDTRGLW